MIKNAIDSIKYDIKTIVLYGLGLGLFLLTGYFAAIYVGLCFFVVALAIIQRKNFKQMMSLFLILIISVLTVVILCPNYFCIDNDNEQISVIRNLLTLFNISTLKEGIPPVFSYLNKYMFYSEIFYPCLFLFLVNLVFNFKNNTTKFGEKLSLLFIFISLLWMFIVMNICVYKLSRYILAAFPILSLLYVLFIKKSKPVLQIVIVLVFLFISVNQLASRDYFDGDKSGFISKRIYGSNIPVILNNNNDWQAYYFIFCLKKKGVLLFKPTKEDLSTPKFMYFVLNPDPLPSEKDAKTELLESRWNAEWYFVQKIN